MFATTNDNVRKPRSIVLLGVLLSGLMTAAAQTQLVARYNMANVTGTITFSQTTIGSDVTVELDLEGLGNARYVLELHEFRVDYDSAQLCGLENIGGRYVLHQYLRPRDLSVSFN